MIKRLGLGMVAALVLEASAAYGVIQSGLISFGDEVPADTVTSLAEGLRIDDVRISPPIASSGERVASRVALSLTNQSQVTIQAVSMKATFSDMQGSLLGVREFVPLLASEDNRVLLPGASIATDQTLWDITLSWANARISLDVWTIIPQS